jgi:hypothetical protein
LKCLIHCYRCDDHKNQETSRDKRMVEYYILPFQ